MANICFHQILSYIRSSFYYFKNQLIIDDIDKYHVIFLLSAIYMNKMRKINFF